MTDSAANATQRNQGGTVLHVDDRAPRLCIYCHAPIRWMHTRYSDQKLPFNAELLPRELDNEATGWIPGVWPIKGRTRVVMAPLMHYGRAKRSRVRRVAVLHQCRSWTAARAAALAVSA